MVQSEIVNEQKHTVNKGLDFTLIPQELKANQEDFAEVLENLENNNQNLFTFTGLAYYYGNT